MPSHERSDRASVVVERANAAFGDADKAARWLRRPTRALDGSAPLDLLDTDVGALRVETLLGRIEHGNGA
jgi:putative toxin-antitoxin system antitoxin component (TIGR02293 family)